MYPPIIEDDEYITEVNFFFCEGMKEYYSYVVQQEARMEINSNQDKLANEVKKYPEKLRLFKQQRQDYEAIFSDALDVAESEDVDEMRTAEHHKNFLQKLFDNLIKLVYTADVVQARCRELFECSTEKLPELHTFQGCKGHRCKVQIDNGQRTKVGKRKICKVPKL